MIIKLDQDEFIQQRSPNPYTPKERTLNFYRKSLNKKKKVCRKSHSRKQHHRTVTTKREEKSFME